MMQSPSPSQLSWRSPLGFLARQLFVRTYVLILPENRHAVNLAKTTFAKELLGTLYDMTANTIAKSTGHNSTPMTRGGRDVTEVIDTQQVLGGRYWGETTP